MIDEVSHNCGVVVAHTLHDVYSFIKSLQHRGREAAGIAAIGDARIDVIKWRGTVSTFDITDLYKILDSSRYHTYMAHVRYATRGRKDKILEDAHPHVIGGRIEDRGNHIILMDCDAAIVHNGTLLDESLSEVDRSLCRTGCDSEALLHLFYNHKSERDILKNVSGSFTAAIAHKRRNDVIVMRDKKGMKPGVLGWKDGKYCVVSEDIALRKNGGIFRGDLQPGAVYYMHPDGTYEKEIVVQPNIKHCFFEWNYLCDVESIVNGASVLNLRTKLGEILAEEFPFRDIDFVTFLPRCPEAAAIRYAEILGIPFINLFYKMRSERAFQGSTADDRKLSIYQNVFLNPETTPLINGKKVAVIDDSLIRGNNIRRERELLAEAGAAEARHINYTPQIGIIGEDGNKRFCKGGGVDMTLDDDYIARGRSPEEISDKVGMAVHYISHEGMFRAFSGFGLNKDNLCHFCIGGPDIFDNR